MKWLIVLLTAFGGAFLLTTLSLQQVWTDISTPRDISASEYVQSTDCVNCHPAQYETWYATYHRTMTQEANHTAVVGDFDNATFTYKGVTSRFWQEDGRYFIDTLSLDTPDGGNQLQTYEVDMTVGSRRFQQYVTQQGDRHIRLPVAWNISEGRWIHLNGGFLDPDETPFNSHAALWDANCIFCHNVKAQPGYDFEYQTFDAQVAELGIACEACHGPAAEHVALNSNPLRRYALYAGFTPRDPTLYSPHELPELQQIQLCGHCHGQRLPNPTDRLEQFLGEGDPFTAGDDLNQYTTPIFQDSELGDLDLSLRFWADGTPRLSAYEYQGILLSDEHEGSGLVCTSCHSMHGGNPEGMITDEMKGNTGCTQCHDDIAEDITAHTKHLPGSTGSDCYACHMPKNTYGLLAIHRTHHIENPDPSRAWQYEMPEACTSCHVDQTAVWAATAHAEQYGLDAPSLPEKSEFHEVAEPIRALLMGDVVQRAVAIDALTAVDSYTDDPVARLWAVPYLLIAMEDNYPAIRHFGERGLRQLLARAAANAPELVGNTAVLPRFDYLAEEDERTAVLAEWWAWWQQVDKSRIRPVDNTAVLLDDNLQPRPELVQPLLEQRSNVNISIGE